MMHGHEKSDPAIVAVKPANKTEQPVAERSAAEPTAAEPVEPRAGTKGNADQQSTCRTQSRVSVSQALDRIRKVARERKKEKFTALFHHISVELLGDAFYELKEDCGGREVTRVPTASGLLCCTAYVSSCAGFRTPAR